MNTDGRLCWTGLNISKSYNSNTGILTINVTPFSAVVKGYDSEKCRRAYSVPTVTTYLVIGTIGNI